MGRETQESEAGMGRRFGANKDTEKMIRLAQKQGWEVEFTKSNHIKFRAPSGELIIAGLSSNDSGVLQTRRRLVKAGLRL